MPTRELLSPAQRAQFLSLPAEMSEQMLARYYTLSSEDLLRIRRHRRSHNKLGFAVQLAYLRFPWRTWTASEEASPLVVSYIANQLKVNPMGIMQYASEREATRFEHLAELQKAYGFRQFTARDYRDLSAWLMPLALSTDAGPALVEALIEEMRERKIIIPGITTVERLEWEVRHRAQRQVFRLLTEGLTDLQRMQLQALLTVPAASRQTLLVWLRQPPGAASLANFLKVVERLRWIRALGLDPQVTSRVHQNRLQQLAREGARMTAQRLGEFDASRRDATLVAFLLATAEDLVDQALDMHDKLLGQQFKKGERKHQQLRPWMEEAVKSGISKLKSFVAGIERDYDAVKEALRLPWSQGVTEGKVNKLKTIKRQMYGRAGFPLLRQRLLHDA